MFQPILTSIQNLSIGYVVTNTDHEVLLVNLSALDILAATKTTKTLEEVVQHIPERLALLDHVRYCSLEHKSCSFREVEIGNRKVRVFLSPIFEGEELRGNVLTLEDITEKVESDRARDQFLAFLVHELRTPLTAIKGNVALIEAYYKSALQDANLREMVGDINSGSKYLLQMVNQFLDMSRLEEGRIEYDLRQFDAGAVAHESVQSLRVLATERGLTLELEPVAKPIEVAADPGRMKQVLTNMIGNALKFTETGGVRVVLMTKNDNLELSVIDTGPGVPPESRAGMFQKYFQAANNKLRKDSTKSTGLGLYVTKLMVEGMGGRIFLSDPQPKKGAMFTLTLPLATTAHLKNIEKMKYDAAQGVQHAPATEHTSIPV